MYMVGFCGQKVKRGQLLSFDRQNIFHGATTGRTVLLVFLKAFLKVLCGNSVFVGRFLAFFFAVRKFLFINGLDIAKDPF